MAISIRNTHQKQFTDEFRGLTGKYNGWQVWEDFVVMAACAISNSVDKRNYEKREAHYMSRIKRYESKDAQAFPKLMAITVAALDDNPEQDFLGELFMMLELSNHWKGQFFTPYSVCRMMAEIQFNGLPEGKPYISVNDPACGAGATLIAFANVAKEKGINYQNHIQFVAQDIDQTAALMCYLQLSLLGCAGYVVIADTLRHPVLTAETEVWYTPFYLSDVWHWRRTFKRLDGMLQAMPRAENRPSQKEEAIIEEQPMQLTLF